ncbi:hypothetical protein ARMSODRAFT_982569 [Armillaria solidipes]|uniref:Uncharacterized protein n=1 Tax=Armillaria solidipes TaxID=1076256 RepID=A0A2H3B8E0_9AGAR|nr:hypothetical protein ARMSODRAFT_982569 [Armillaria solidipes]
MPDIQRGVFAQELRTDRGVPITMYTEEDTVIPKKIVRQVVHIRCFTDAASPHWCNVSDNERILEIDQLGMAPSNVYGANDEVTDGRVREGDYEPGDLEKVLGAGSMWANDSAPGGRTGVVASFWTECAN